MSAPWFYSEDLAGEVVVLGESESRHAGGSRRLRQGDPITLFDGRGGLAHGVLRESTSSRGKRQSPLEVLIRERVQIALPVRRLTLITAAPKGPRLDYLVEKCTELGVDALLLAGFERSVARPAAGHVDKLRRAVIEACKQCRRAWRMRVESQELSAALSEIGDGAGRLLAHPSAETTSAEPVTSLLAAREAAVVIGPEGGLSDSELERMQADGWRAFRLAEHVLRVETAAVAAAALWASATA